MEVYSQAAARRAETTTIMATPLVGTAGLMEVGTAATEAGTDPELPRQAALLLL